MEAHPGAVEAQKNNSGVEAQNGASEGLNWNPVVADLHHDEEQGPDPRQSEKSEPDPHQSKKDANNMTMKVRRFVSTL